MTDAKRQELDRRIRRDFPLLERYPEIAYLDNAATTQKPESVIRAESRYYEEANANPLRGLYQLSVDATEVYEKAREAVRDFIHADSSEEIVFTRNATESLNLLAYSWGDANLKEGDEVLITIMEHHSNLLPWMMVCRRTGARLRYLECEKDGTIGEESFRAALTPRTRLVAMTQVSNVLGCRNDIRTFAALAHEAGAVFAADGAQSVPHIPVNVKDLDVDFLVFSGHKMLAPMGIGVLYGKRDLLEAMPPFLTGGEMIEYVRRDSATYAELPHKFEAGTVNVGGAAGLLAAIEYYREIGFDRIQEREDHLTCLAMGELLKLPYVHILGSADPLNHHGILTFTVDGVHPHDVAAMLDADGVNIRAGHHCAQPLLKYLEKLSTTRASFSFYNTEEEAMRLVESISRVRGKMGYAD